MSEFKELKLSDIFPSSTNPRSEFEENSIKELAESIKQHGVLQPIIVREQASNYELVCGERRYRAAKIAKLKFIPASIRELSDDEVFEIQIIENLERKDVHPLDEAKAFKKMLDSGKYTIDDIAAKVAKTTTFVKQRLKLNDLIPELLEDFLKGEFGIGHAVLFSTLETKEQKRTRDYYLDRCYNAGYPTIKDLRQYIQRNGCDLEDVDFDIDDTELYAEAGACTNCPNCSLSNQSLFPELEDKVCFDRKCYDKKTDKHLINVVQKIVDENPGIVLILDDFEDVGEEFTSHFVEQGKPLFENFIYSNEEAGGVYAYHVTDNEYEWIKINDNEDEENDKTTPTSDINQNIKNEISNIKTRADRALELDREKIYKRVVTEIIKNEEKNEKLFSDDELTLEEKHALFYTLVSFYDDKKWLSEKTGVDEIGYSIGRIEFIKENYSDKLLNILIRKSLKRTLVSEMILDYEKHDSPRLYFEVVKNYFPAEIELFTLEQNAIAEKRISKSDDRIAELEKSLNIKNGN